MHKNSNFRKKVLIATSQAAPSVTTAKNGLEDGVVALVKEDLTFVAWGSLSTGERYFLVQGQGIGKKLVYSAEMIAGSENSGENSVKWAVFSHSKEQISYVGYNGTSGALPTTADTNYSFVLTMKGNSISDRTQPCRFYPNYKVAAGASNVQYTLANGLAKSVNKQFSDEAEANKLISAAMVCDEAGVGAGISGAAAAYEFGASVNVVKGSKEVTFTASCLPAGTSTTGLAVGDFLRFGVMGAGAVPGVTLPVYRIASIAADGLTATLESAYRGETTTLGMDNTIAQSEIGVIASATGLAAEFGVRIVSEDNQFDAANYAGVEPNRFVISVGNTSSNLTSTTVTTTQNARTGNGTYKQAANAEFTSRGEMGEPTLGTPPHIRSTVLGDQSAVIANDTMHSDVRPYNRRAFGVITIKQVVTPVDGIAGSGKYPNDTVIFVEVSDGTNSSGTKNDASANAKGTYGVSTWLAAATTASATSLDTNVYA